MQKEKTILFLHGFYASGQCVPAVALREAFEGKANVLTPDLPLHPHDAIRLIREICDQEKPDILVGNSCGSFYAQIISPIVGIPALLGNPHFKMSDFLRERIGNHQYKSPRADGKQDTLAHFEPLFLEHYHNTFHFPGGHTPTAEQFKTWYVPLIEKLMIEYPIQEDKPRYFQHFKGNKYKLVHIALDSETQERMVVYQALYGDRKYWVRPEKMFFETIERDGKRFSRFTEIDWEE